MATLTAKLSPIVSSLQKGKKSLDGIIEMLRLRVDAETQFTNSLRHILNSSNHLISTIDSTTSLKTHGFDALYVDMKNEYHQRLEYLNSLKVDVYEPCVRMKSVFDKNNKSLLSETKRKSKQFDQHQAEYKKLKEKYDKLMSKTTKNTKETKQRPVIKRRYSQTLIVYKQQKSVFDAQMEGSLEKTKLMNYQRMKTLQDALTKWTISITNLCSNRSYDTQNLRESMALIDIEKDSQFFIDDICAKRELTENIPKSEASKNTVDEQPYASSLYAQFRRQSASRDSASALMDGKYL